MFRRVRNAYGRTEHFIDANFEQFIPASIGLCLWMGMISDQLHKGFVVPAIILFSWSLVWIQKSVTVWWLEKFIGVAPVRSIYKLGGW